MARGNAVSANQPITHRERSSSLPPLITKPEPRKAALLIGCIYKDNKHHFKLVHPHDDVKKLKDLLICQYGYEKANIKVLLDDGKHEPPTKANIEREMKNLVAGAKAGDKLFFHFSGHGEQTPCLPEDKTEPDGMDEAIVPCDATDDKDTWIIDNHMNKLLVRKIPVNAQLIALFDMCHSGTALDLKHYCYDVHAFKRTSHEKVENEARRFNELPSLPDSNGENVAGPSADQRKKTRKFSLATRRSTMHCELSEGSDASQVTKPIATGETLSAMKVTHRGNSCAECGGFLEEHPQVSELDQEPDHQGFVPPRPADSPVAPQRPAPQRKAKVLDGNDLVPGEQHHAPVTATTIVPAIPDRRHTIASPRERKWKLSKPDSKDAEKAKGSAPQSPSRASTATSVTPLLPSSAPAPRSASVSSLTSTSSPRALNSLRFPKPSKAFLTNRPAPSVAAPALDTIREDSQGSKFSDGEDNIPRCQSPEALSPNSAGPVSPTSARAPTLASSSVLNISGPNAENITMTKKTVHRKCNCRAASGWQEHGQVITIGAAHDSQLSWESKQGTLTSAIVEILKKDAHPTYRSLISSIQQFLNGVSDEMRQYRTRERKHVVFKKFKRDAEKHEQHQPPKQGRPPVQRSRSASASVPASTSASASTSRRNSHKSGNDFVADIFEAIDATLENANGGPVQEVMIGTEHHMDLKKEVFHP